MFCEGCLVDEGLAAVDAGEQVVLGVAAQGLQVEEGLWAKLAGKQVPWRRGTSWGAGETVDKETVLLCFLYKF